MGNANGSDDRRVNWITVAIGVGGLLLGWVASDRAQSQRAGEEAQHLVANDQRLASLEGQLAALKVNGSDALNAVKAELNAMEQRIATMERANGAQDSLLRDLSATIAVNRALLENHMATSPQVVPQSRATVPK